MDLEQGLWIAAIQVKVLSSTDIQSSISTITPAEASGDSSDSSEITQPYPAASTGSNQNPLPKIKLDQILLLLQRYKEEIYSKLEEIYGSGIEEAPELAVLLPMTGASLFFGFVWIVILVIPLLFGFKVRWFWGSLVFSLFLGPLGFLFSTYIAILTIFRSEKIKNSSPKELLEELVTSPVMIGILAVIFLILTAVSVLGGFIAFAILFLFYQFIRLLLPGSGRRTAVIPVNNTSGSDGSYLESSSSSSGESDYSGYGSSNYEDSSYDDNDNDDNDDDDREDRSIWDGWLVEW